MSKFKFSCSGCGQKIEADETYSGKRLQCPACGEQLIVLVKRDAIREAESLGAGEILVNSIDHDGKMKGYDLTLATLVRAATRLPITLLGGAGSLADIGQLIATCGVVGAAAGSLFVFKGPYRAVLISYPSLQQKDDLIHAAQSSAAGQGRRD
jgi:cyclase